MTTPDWVQDFPVRRRTGYDGNGKDGENGNDGLSGPQSIIIIKDKWLMETLFEFLNVQS